MCFLIAASVWFWWHAATHQHVAVRLWESRAEPPPPLSKSSALTPTRHVWVWSKWRSLKASSVLNYTARPWCSPLKGRASDQISGGDQRHESVLSRDDIDNYLVLIWDWWATSASKCSRKSVCMRHTVFSRAESIFRKSTSLNKSCNYESIDRKIINKDSDNWLIY